MTLPYNLLMLAIDLYAIRLLGRSKKPAHACAVFLCAGAAAMIAGGLLGGLFENHFGVFRLWAYGLFLHIPILLAAMAFLCRRRWPPMAATAGPVLVALLAVAVDAFFVEPHWLEVTHLQISTPKIDRPLRIAVVADLQTDRLGPYERETLRRVMAEKPDLILLAGDYLQVPERYERSLRNQLREILRELHFSAPLGVFAVRGNVESPDWTKIFDGLPITPVEVNQSFDLGDLRLTCLGLSSSFNIGLKITNPEPARFHLVLGHSPNFSLGQIDADLLVAGHTHGGQVRLPGIGPIITHSRIPHRWAAGLTELANGAKLLVSRGIGMERDHAPPMRFLCRPEIVVIDLVNSSRQKCPLRPTASPFVSLASVSSCDSAETTPIPSRAGQGRGG